MALSLTDVADIGASMEIKKLLQTWKTELETEGALLATASAVPNITSSEASPSGVVMPTKVGDLHVDTSAGALYVAHGPAGFDWFLTTGEDA
jgi:hypothetical protein